MPLFDWGNDTWAALRDMQRELGRLFGGLGRGGWGSRESQMVGGGGFPPVSIHDREDSLVVLAELPGVPMESLDLSITDDTLVIKGAKPETAALKVPEANYHRQERGAGQFSRTIVLPDPVRADGIKASLSRGILRIDLPKSESAKPRKIGVKPG